MASLGIEILVGDTTGSSRVDKKKEINKNKEKNKKEEKKNYDSKDQKG